MTPLHSSQKLISPLEYRKTVQRVAMVFQGRTQELLDILNQQMHKAAEELNFESAARIRDQIAGLKSLHAEQKVSLPDDTVSRDAIALAADEQHVLFVAGSNDGKLPEVLEKAAQSLEGKAGSVAFKSIPGGGHLPMCDQPSAFLQAVLPFLSS